MGLSVWFADDLQGALSAGIVMAIETDGGHNRAYLGGVLAMGKGLALSFGLSWGAILRDCRQALGDDLEDCLTR